MNEWMTVLNQALAKVGIDGGETLWISQVFIVVFVTLVANWIAVRLLNRLHQTLIKGGEGWDDVVIDAVRKPLGFLIWLIGLLWAASIVGQRTEAEIFSFVGPLRHVGVIFIIAWAVKRLIAGAEEHYKKPRPGREEIDETTVDAIAKLLQVAVVITAGLVMLQTLGFSVSGVLAFGGIGGIAVGFAAKDLLANFFGGLMIYLDRPFAVGEWVRSPDKEIEGTVEYIGWRLTRVRTFDKRPLYVPNATFTSISVENPSRMTNRRIKETIGIRYDDASKMGVIVEDVKSMLKNHPDIDTGQTLIVNFNAFNASSLDFFIYTFTKTTNWVLFHEIKQDVLLKVIEIIEGHGAEIAFPTRTLHMVEDHDPQGLGSVQQAPV